MSEARTSRLCGIVLRGRSLGEADRIFTFLSAERGKFDAVAKGVRRSRSAFAGRLQFMNEVALELHHGRSLDLVTGAEIRVSYFDAIVEPDVFATASLLAEYVDAATEHEQAAPEVFALLQQALAALVKSKRPRGIVPRFSMRLLGAIGLAPELYICVHCGRPAGEQDDLWIDIENGGIACGTCRGHRERVPQPTYGELENLRALAQAAGGHVPATSLAKPANEGVIEEFMRFHLGTRPRIAAALEMFHVDHRT